MNNLGSSVILHTRIGIPINRPCVWAMNTMRMSVIVVKVSRVHIVL